MFAVITGWLGLLGAVPQLTLAGALTEPGQEMSRASDSAAIEWILPGEFERARKRATDENKILLVKGVSFGIDELGARDATRGQW